MTVHAPGLPFVSLNLRRNPFGSPRPGQGPDLAVVEIDDLVTFLEGGPGGLPDPGAGASGRRGGPDLRAVQLVGPPGSGKSTRLGALASRLEAAACGSGPRPVLRWAWEAEEGWPAAPGGPGSHLVVDDAHLLGPRMARHVLGRRRIALASHEDLASPLRRAGYGVRTLRVAEQLDPGLLRAVVDRRVEAARRGPGPVPRPPDALLDRLLAAHAPDVRAILGELYEWIQRLDREGAGAGPGSAPGEVAP